MTAPKRILIAEISPLQRLAAAGESALDRLFEDTAEVLVADLVVDEIMHDEAETNTLRAWFEKNRGRIRIIETATGKRRRDESARRDLAKRLWDMAGQPENLKPIALPKTEKTAEEVSDDEVWTAIRTATAIVDAASAGDVVLADDDVMKTAIAARMRRKNGRARVTS